QRAARLNANLNANLNGRPRGPGVVNGVTGPLEHPDLGRNLGPNLGRRPNLREIRGSLTRTLTGNLPGHLNGTLPGAQGRAGPAGLGPDLGLRLGPPGTAWDLTRAPVGPSRRGARCRASDEDLIRDLIRMVSSTRGPHCA